MANDLRQRAQERSRLLKESIVKNNENTVTDAISMFEEAAEIKEAEPVRKADPEPVQETIIPQPPKKKQCRRYCISMDNDVAELMEIPVELNGGKLSRYIESVVRKDLEKNLEKYKMLLKMKEEM